MVVVVVAAAVEVVVIVVAVVQLFVKNMTIWYNEYQSSIYVDILAGVVVVDVVACKKCVDYGAEAGADDDDDFVAF